MSLANQRQQPERVVADAVQHQTAESGGDTLTARIRDQSLATDTFKVPFLK